MTPSFDPQAILDDAVNTAKQRGSSALLWGLLIVGGLVLVTFNSGKRRRR
jgi:hypothetical protein